jgi:hypothetical protein
MREYEGMFSAVNSGLRAFKQDPKPSLIDCFNAMPMGEEGLWVHEPVMLIEPLAPVCGDWEVTHPWPQIRFGTEYNVGFAVADADDCSTGVPVDDEQVVFYEVTKNGDNWIVDPMGTLGYLSRISQVDMVDFGQFYVVCSYGQLSGVDYINSIYRIPWAEKPTTQIGACDVATIPKFITGCNFNGQAVVGGISSGQTFWANCGLASVCWSGIGNFNFLPTDNVTAGYTHMNWGKEGTGIVYKIRKLGNNVVVFGSGGITALTPVSDPVSTFGQQNLSLCGVASGNHVAGDDENLGWIDNNFDFWIMSGKVSAKKKLGYREWFSVMTGDIVVSYVTEKKRFYICDGVTCYVLAEGGLYSCHQLVTSLGVFDNELVGLFEDTGDTSWRVETNEIDFGQRSFKTLQFVEIMKSDEMAAVKVKFRSSLMASDYSELDWKNVNPNGIVYCPVSGIDFRICVSGSEYPLSTNLLSAIKFRFKMTDKRNIRGLYGTDKNSA